MDRVIVFAERVLPSTQTFIPAQVSQLKHFAPIYAGLLPAQKSFDLGAEPILLRADRTAASRVAREVYRWAGIAPSYHARLRKVCGKLIHAHFAEGGSPALFLSKHLNVPLILQLHGGAELMTDANLRRAWFEWPFLAHRRSLWKRASAFLCASRYVSELAVKAGFPADKVHVHLAALDCTTFSPRLTAAEKDANLIVFVGRLIPYKGCDYLIRAMELVQQQRHGSRLVIIGDGTARGDLQQLAATLKVPCEFLGELKPVEVRSWLDKARVFCASSVALDDGQSEAFGVVFLEAQAMGVPVVGFRHGGIPETMQEGVTGLLAEERDVQGLSEQLLRYLGDDIFWDQSRMAAMQWVRNHFDPTTQATKLEEIYLRAIRGFQSQQFEQSMQGARCPGS